MNLFQIARDNAEAFSRRYEAMRAATDAAALAILDQFVAAVLSDGRLSVNLRPTALLRFLALEGRYYNVHEWADDLALRSGQPREELLRQRLKDYYDPRMAFDRFLDQGAQFRYGALNLGGLGAIHYGTYCLVFGAAFASGLSELAYLWADSLETYLLPGEVIDEAGLRHDACPHSHRHCQAALKHGVEAVGLTEESWPALVCSRSGFIEAVFIAHPIPGDVQAVRMDRFDYELYSSFVVDAALGRLSDYDRHLVDEFDTLLSLLEKSSIPLETVAA
jgi:hypothetical protein